MAKYIITADTLRMEKTRYFEGFDDCGCIGTVRWCLDVSSAKLINALEIETEKLLLVAL
jgi:hypothetical protein